MSIKQKYILRRLMRNLKYPFWFGDYMYRKFMLHPQNSSLAAYHFILSWIGIENYGVTISSDTLATDIPLPAITYIYQNDGEFVIVERIDDKDVVFHDGHKAKKVTRSYFDEIFSGNAIILEPDSKLVINNKDYFRWFIPYISRSILLVVLFITIIVKLLVFQPLNILELTYVILFIIGFVASIMLFSKHLGVQNKLTNTICTSGGEATNCNAVMGSKGGSLFGLISWSDIGIIYFATVLSLMLLFEFYEIKLIIFILSMCATPYVFYSIFYQWKVVQTWCPLCLIVQFVFIGQLILSIIVYINGDLQFFLLPTLSIVSIAMIIGSIVFVLNPIFESASKLPYAESAYMRFRLEHKIQKVCIGSFQYNTSSVNQILYNPDSRAIITFVFNPFCGPCIAKISGILSFMQKYDIGLRFVLCIKDITKQNDLPIIEFFINEYLESPDNFLKLLKDYSENYSVIRQKKKSFKADLQEVKDIISTHTHWFIYNKFVGTPVILLNNVLIPSNYLIEDIEIMIVNTQE